MEETIESNENKEKKNGENKTVGNETEENETEENETEENETEGNEIVENVETTDEPKVGCIFFCIYSFMKTVSVFELS